MRLSKIGNHAHEFFGCRRIGYMRVHTVARQRPQDEMEERCEAQVEATRYDPVLSGWPSQLSCRAKSDTDLRRSRVSRLTG